MKYTSLNIYCTNSERKELIDELDSIAKATFRSRSSLIKFMLRQMIDRYKADIEEASVDQD